MGLNEDIIRQFYSSLQRGDVEGMIANYHETIEFQDPVFGVLRRNHVGNMWRMLLERPSGLVLKFSEVEADNTAGSAVWSADYVFGKQQRPVHNEAVAYFQFKNGKISEHIDDFNFHKWASQALGARGMLFGWVGAFQSIVQKRSRSMLSRYEKKHGL